MNSWLHGCSRESRVVTAVSVLLAACVLTGRRVVTAVELAPGRMVVRLLLSLELKTAVSDAPGRLRQ